MSSTTTTTTQTVTGYPLRAVLADYELHKSEPRTAAEPSTSQPRAQNPPGWSQNHRAVPAYRPVNTELDRDQIMVYRNNGERAFINTMFFGIQVVTVGYLLFGSCARWRADDGQAAHRTWCATGGKINERWFRYEVGGEY